MDFFTERGFMFYGTWPHVIDKRGRIVVPFDFAKELGSIVAVLPNGNGVMVYPEKCASEFSADEIAEMRKIRIRRDKRRTSARLTIPSEFRIRFFHGCKKVKWVGYRTHFMVTPF